MAGILRRIFDFIRASLNSLIERAEDPEKMLGQMMRDMQASYQRSKVEVAKVLAEKHRIAAQLQRADKGVQDWERRAVAALKADDELLARKALERKRSHAEHASTLRAQMQEQNAAAEQLKDALIALENKISEARLKKSLLSARHQRALAQKRIHRALEASGGATAFENLSRLESHIQDLEAEAMAAAELSAGDSLEERFRELEGADVEEELLLLKEKMSGHDALTRGDAAALPPSSDASGA